MSEYPLHVRVAQALGWNVDHYQTMPLPWLGGHSDEKGYGVLPRYDTDWLATGPLIEKHKLLLWPRANEWAAMPRDQKFTPATGQTPLVAICNLILALKEAGKLADPGPHKGE